MLYLADEQQKKIENFLKSSLVQVIIKRGWSYYTSKRIKRMELTVHETITAYAEGTDIYAVVIDLDELRYSSCSCPFKGTCKHIAAVFFQAVAEQAGGHKAAEQAYFRLLGLTKASAAISVNRDISDQAIQAPFIGFGDGRPEESDKLLVWREWMDKQYGEVWRTCRHSLHPLQPVLTGLKAVARDWSFKAQKLFWCYAILYVLEQAERAISLADSFNRYYYEMAFLRMSEPWLAQFHELIDDLDPDKLSDKDWEWSLTIVGELKRRALLLDRQLLEWDYIYLAALQAFGKQPEWLRNEEQAIGEMLESKAGAAINQTFLRIAAGSIAFDRGEYENALNHFSLADFDRAQKAIYRSVDRLLEMRQEAAVETWMAYIFEQVQQSPGKRSVGPFMQLCTSADEAYPEQKIWSDYMLGLLPQSYIRLSEHWMRLGRYQDWADLQLLSGVKIEAISPEEEKKVSKHAPQLMFPLYHQSIEAAIQSRNRQGYRLAVKQLKRLSKLYSASPFASRWPVFIEQLTDKYQRLRAFQEELWKGNLLQ